MLARRSRAQRQPAPFLISPDVKKRACAAARLGLAFGFVVKVVGERLTKLPDPRGQFGDREALCPRLDQIKQSGLVVGRERDGPEAPAPSNAVTTPLSSRRPRA
jgi:hypothetical protein